MADLTQGAVDSLVGLLKTAVTKEAKLLGGLQGDMEFIKDEMESMNGFLIHLTKTEGMHDDQLRAWMKQVRDISYIAQDCIELYRRDFMAPPTGGLRARLRHYLLQLGRLRARDRLARRISDLKARVKDVAERRERYQVSIPKPKEDDGLPPQWLALDAEQASLHPDEIHEARENFLRALARDKEKQELSCFDEATGLLQSTATKPIPSYEEAIGLLVPQDLQSTAIQVRRCLLQHFSHQRDRATVCLEMLLRALQDHSRVRRAIDKSKGELNKLVDEAGMDINDFPTQVMIFCYSKLSRSYKSCLQYLYAFRDETAISRTSLVRRWLAEGRVERQAGASKQADASLEEVAEICFKDLLFRGFLLPADDPATVNTKVKTCKIDNIVWKFLRRMSTTDNFVDSLPTHLDYQLRIRQYVKRQEEHLHGNHPRPRHSRSICGRGTMPLGDSAAADPDPMVDMLNFLNSLDQTYRLNVLDLGGCKGLEKSHLKSICKIISLKYLSLRNTDVSHLPWQINNLVLLETLDIRQTKVQGQDINQIYLRKLKHLLTSFKMKMTTEEETLCWAGMPSRIGKMEDMEILSRVQIQDGKKELNEVGRLVKLRKLGVVLAGSQSQAQDNMNNLLQAITKLRECLCSLSIWITPSPTNNGDPSVIVNMEMVQEQSAPKLLKSLNIRGVRFLNTRLPGWIRELQQLSEITLCDTFLSRYSLQDLGNNLHHLRCLRLRRSSYNDHKLTFGKDGFQELRLLIIEGNTVTTVEFQEDMSCPRLKKIVWRNMSLKQEGTLSGIQHLEGLEDVELKGCFADLTSIANNMGPKGRLIHVLHLQD
ncbi:disease resistance protein RPM1-like [Hordeum vulgare]|nr:disease resistance protein RPM1-like [Hordeum vulgare]